MLLHRNVTQIRSLIGFYLNLYPSAIIRLLYHVALAEANHRERVCSRRHIAENEGAGNLIDLSMRRVSRRHSDSRWKLGVCCWHKRPKIELTRHNKGRMAHLTRGDNRATHDNAPAR